MTSFGEVLKEARTYRDLDLKQLALKMGKPEHFRNYISSIERGLIQTRADGVHEFAEHLDVVFVVRGEGWAFRPNK